MNALSRVNSFRLRPTQVGERRIHRYLPYLLSGLLLGLSYPSYPYVRLEVLAWVWMVPLLLALREVRSFWGVLGRIYLTTLVVCVLPESPLLTSHAWGTILLFFVSAVVLTVPFISFYLIRNALGWRVALLSAPVVWTAWDWLYHQSEGSFGWLAMGITQSNLYWLVQYVDITGVWGITFWIVLFNVLVVMAIEECGVQSAAPVIRTPHSALRNRLVRRLALVAAAMLLPPLLYSAFVFIREARAAADDRAISVLMVQPNVDPWQKFDQNTVTLAKATALTDSALGTQKPDLIIWPETAVPYVLAQDKVAREFVYRAVSRWKTPLLTGTLDASDAQTFNAAVLLAPEPRAANSPLTVDASALGPRATKHRPRTNPPFSVKSSEMYHKRSLFPFVERVPFQARFPALARLIINVGGRGGFSPGETPTVFSFRARQGEPVTVAAAICYDQLYPAQIAEFVQHGANLMALITNEGWWSKTHGAYWLAASTRLRAIETRRTIARTANTGVTCFIDPLGRIYDQAPWWEEQTVMGKVRLSNEMSLYVRYTDYFPKACVWLALALALAAIIQTARSLVSRQWSVVHCR